MTDISRLRELAKHLRRLAEMNGADTQTCRESADAILALLDRLDAEKQRADAAERLIVEHNNGLQESCDARAAHGDCEAWRGRGRCCTDCPREWSIDALANREGGE